jgi:hypothetical protein
MWYHDKQKIVRRLNRKRVKVNFTMTAMVHPALRIVVLSYGFLNPMVPPI